MLEQVYREHRQGLYTLALSITGSPALAEDAIQQAFVQLCNRNGELPQPVGAYVYTTVRNAAIDLQRKNRREGQRMESIFNGFIAPPESPDPAGLALTSERERLLRSAVNALAQEDREIVVLKAFAGLTFDEISQTIGMPMKTVATRYRRLLVRLGEQLGDMR